MSLTRHSNTARSALTVAGAQTAIVSRNIAARQRPRLFAQDRQRRHADRAAASASPRSRAPPTRRSSTPCSRPRRAAAACRARSSTGSNTCTRRSATREDERSPRAADRQASPTRCSSTPPSPSDASLGAARRVARATISSSALNDAPRRRADVRRDADAGMADVRRPHQRAAVADSRRSTPRSSGTRAGARRHRLSRPARRDRLGAFRRDRHQDQLARRQRPRHLHRQRRHAVRNARPPVTFQPPLGLVADAAAAMPSMSMACRSPATPPACRCIRAASPGFAAIRDNSHRPYQSQLDEIAPRLIATFAETDQNAVPTLPDVPGLFTWSGAPAMPGRRRSGLAGSIRVNANVDPAQGGDPSLLRDGGISDPGNPAYIYNTHRRRRFTDRLQALIAGARQPASFDPSRASAPTSTSAPIASASAGWLEAAAQACHRPTPTTARRSLSRATEALSQRDRRQSRRRDDHHAGARALLPGVGEADLGHRPDVRHALASVVAMKTSYVSTMRCRKAHAPHVLELQAELAEGADRNRRAGGSPMPASRSATAPAETVSLPRAITRGSSAIIATNGLVGVAARRLAGGARRRRRRTPRTSRIRWRWRTSAQCRPVDHQDKAGLAIKSMTASSTSSINGEYLFAGINTDVMPVADYSRPASPARQAVADAFTAHFGFAQYLPTVAAISAADMEDFLDTDFAALFDDAGWTGELVVGLRPERPAAGISTSELVTTGVNANDRPSASWRWPSRWSPTSALENMSADAPTAWSLTRAMTVTRRGHRQSDRDAARRSATSQQQVSDARASACRSRRTSSNTRSIRWNGRSLRGGDARQHAARRRSRRPTP